MLNTSVSLWMGMCLLLSPLCPDLNAAITSNPNLTITESEMCNEKPLIYCPSFVWLKPSESAHPNRTGYALADPGGPNCGTPIVTYTDEIYVINACHKVYTRIWTATDPNNSSLLDTCHQTIKQVDEEKPVFRTPLENIEIYTDNMDPNTINCSTQVFWTAPIVSDNHRLTSVTYIASRNGTDLNLRSGDYFLDGITTITYTAFDYCGNFSTASFDINVMCADCHLDCPADVCLPLNSDTSPQAIGFATAYNDNTNCGTVTPYFMDELIETGCNGKTKTVRTWYGNFENMPQNTSSCNQIIELKDQSALVLHNCPSDVNVKDNFTKAYWEAPVAVASDPQNVITMTSNFGPGNLFPVGITTIIYTATDACGNEASCSFKVSVLEDASYDNCPTDIEVTCGQGGTAVVNWEAPSYNGSCTTCKRGAPINGFMYMGSLNGSSYYCSKNNYTYEEALILADRHGGHIASINSEAENKYLAKNIISSTAMIGYTDLANEGDFIWEDGSDSGYSNWFHMQPNNQDNQDVVELMKSTGLWNDVENDKKLEVILEIPCENVKQIDGPKPGSQLPTGTYKVEYLISDGCGLYKFCKFEIIVRAGIAILCQDDIYVEVPTSVDTVSVTWNAPFAESCCADCTTPSCVNVIQTEGPPPGSNFFRQSKTIITYTATDPCGNSVSCSFYILVDINEISGRQVTDHDNELHLPDSINTDMDKPKLADETTSTESIATNSSTITIESNETALPSEANEKENYKLKIASIPTKLDYGEESFYPNPVHNTLIMEFVDPSKVKSVEIFNQNGSLVMRYDQNFTKRKQVNLSHLESGLYVIQLRYIDAEIYVQKLVKF